jgi:hypothetical protein
VEDVREVLVADAEQKDVWDEPSSEQSE